MLAAYLEEWPEQAPFSNIKEHVWLPANEALEGIVEID